MEETKLTREEKIETLRIFAGWTAEKKSEFAIGVMVGKHMAEYGAQDQAEAQPA